MVLSNTTRPDSSRLRLSDRIQQLYPDVLTPAALDALKALAGFNRKRHQIMHARIARRDARFKDGQRISFLDPATAIAGTGITVQQARDGPVRRRGYSPRPSVPVDPGHGPGHQASING